MRYSEAEISRIAEHAFACAQGRNKKLCSIDKANVLEVSQLWREVVITVAKKYPQVNLTHMYIDNAAMQLIRDPKQFDVLLTSNLFGDILSDIAGTLTGSIGLLPSASLNAEGKGIYEPVHGSAPDIAGKNIANPLGCILSVAMMLKYSLGYAWLSKKLESAVKQVIQKGLRTFDLDLSNRDHVTTDQMASEIIDEINGG